MKLSDQFMAKVHERNQIATSNHQGAAQRIAYLKSDLINRLAAEMNYSPRSPVAFATFLSARSLKLSGERSEKLRMVDSLTKRQAELTQLIAKQQAIIDSIDPRGTPVHVVADALLQRSALREILNSIPGDALSLPDVGTSNAEYCAQEIERLKTWRGRLRGEHLRIVNDINALGPKSVNLNSFGGGGRLLDDLDYVTRAIDDAGENLKIANGGKVVHEFSISEPRSMTGGETDANVQV